MPNKTSQLIVEKIEINVIYKKIKNSYLSIEPPDGKVIMTVPLNTINDSIKKMVKAKLVWIKSGQKKIKSQEYKMTPKELGDNVFVYFQGDKYQLNIIEVKSTPKIVVEKTKKILNLYVKPNTTKIKKETILKEWYRAELKKLIPPLIKKWEKIIGASPKTWDVRLMKASWGNCSFVKKHILLNLELAKAKPEHLEYILVHEMVHLLQPDHSQKFFRYMSLFLPHWKKLQTELNKFVVGNTKFTE